MRAAADGGGCDGIKSKSAAGSALPAALFMLAAKSGKKFEKKIFPVKHSSVLARLIS